MPNLKILEPVYIHSSAIDDSHGIAAAAHLASAGRVVGGGGLGAHKRVDICVRLALLPWRQLFPSEWIERLLSK